MWFWYFLVTAAFVGGSFYNFGQNGLDDRFMVVQGLWTLTFVVSVGALWVYTSLKGVFAQDKSESSALVERVAQLEREVEMASRWKTGLTRLGQGHEAKLNELALMAGEASLGQTEEIVDILMAGKWDKKVKMAFYNLVSSSEEPLSSEEDQALRKLEEHLGL